MAKTDTLSAGAVALLQEPQLAHFATVMASGAPQVTPVWVDVDPATSHILINTAEGRLKSKNIDRNPDVAVSVVDSNNPYRYVIVRGTVVEQQHEGADAHIDALAHKYLGQETYPWHNPAEQRVIIHIKPHHVLEQGVEGS